DAGSAPARALEYPTPRQPGGAWEPDVFRRGSPAGGGVSTLADLVRFSQALLAGRLVSPEQVRLLTSPKPEVGSRRYGYGFGTAPGPMRIVGHNGGKPGVFAQLDIYPEAGYTTVLLMNQANGQPQGEFVELLRTAVRSMAGVAQPAAAGPSATLPETPAGRTVAAMLETMRGGDTAAIRRFAGERMGERFTSRPLARNLALFQQMRGDLGDARVVSARATDAGIRMVMASARGRFTVIVGVETAPPHRIVGLRVEAEGDDDDAAPAPSSTAAAAPSAGSGRAAAGAVSAGLGGAQAGAQVTLPETPAGRAAAALLATVRAGDTVAIRRFVAERMDAEFQARPMDRTQALFARMRGDFGQGRIVAAVPGENSVRVVLASEQGRFTINLGVEAAPPHRINDLGVRAGGGGDDASASPAAAAAPDAATRMAVVDSIAKLLERLYPSADTGCAIGERLRGRERAGAYASAATLQAFADAVTEDMRAVNGDRHLNVRVGGGRRRVGPGGPPAEGETYGIAASRVLEGGVGYLKLSGLSGHPDAPAALGRALAALGDIRAMIIDLRGTPGGSDEMANAVISHFTGPNIPSLRVVSRSEGTTEVRQTLAEVAGPRRTDIPLYVLVDRRSASAAEDVPFVLQNLGRATIVGEVTAGAGRNNTILPVGAGLAASISVTRVSDPRTGREWELVGVKPEMEVPSEQALDAALRAARERIASGRR
ncbi:MAG TPA: S41 family peptidase, partial [Longimicrobium sp.]|nr:S41 family peptidase [Longimicrobium sp.]